MGTQLLGLPNELLVLILAFLPLRSISSCKRSCRHLRAVIKQSGLLRCRIRTMKNYIENLSPPGLSTADFLESLRLWEKAWLTFSVGKEAATQTLYRPFQGFSEFLLRSGYLIQMFQGDRSGWSYLDLSIQRDLRGKRSAARWTDVQLEANLSTRGWTLDMDQDLVAISCHSPNTRRRQLEIHLLQFTTGTCHESAKVPVMQLEFEGKFDRSFDAHLEVMGDYLVVLLAHGSLFRGYQTLYLLDWTRGQLICRRRVGADTYFPVLTSISGDTLVLGLKRDWALELCKIEKGAETSTFCTLCILKLPAVHPRAHTDLSSFNRASSTTAPPSISTRRSTLPFRSSPSDSVLSFGVSVRRSERSFIEIKTFFFYALPSALRTLAETVTAQASHKGEPKNDKVHNSTPKWLRRHRTTPNTPIVVPWDDWGLKMTRWIVPGSFSVRQALSGMRCAISEWSGRKVRVLDFNPGRLRRVVAVREPGKNGERVLERLAVTTPNTVNAGRCFLRDFQSGLPYYELKRNGVKGDLFMDDEWIAQIQYNGTPEPAGHTIMVHSVVGSDNVT